MEADLAYYRRRSAAEANAAAAALDPVVRDVHLELVRRYAERVATLEAGRARAPAHLVTA
jgi:hypothetical protein